MGWTILILSIALVCGAGVFIAAAHHGAPARHARRPLRGRTAQGPHTVGQHLERRRSGWRSSRHSDAGDLATMARHMHVLRHPVGAHREEDDPFEVLALQCRLTALAAEIQRLERDRSTIALAHHLRATQYAYDVLLAEACQLIGVQTEAEPPPVPDDVGGSWIVDEATRMRKELELSSRGWTW